MSKIGNQKSNNIWLELFFFILLGFVLEKQAHLLINSQKIVIRKLFIVIIISHLACLVL